MQIQVASITLQGTHAVLNGTVNSGVEGVPGTAFNFPVSNEDVYNRVYEPNKTYEFTLGATTPATQPDDTTATPSRPSA